MKRAQLLSLLWLLGCATAPQNPLLEEGKSSKSYVYRDVSGEFELAREIKKDRSKIASRSSILARNGGEKLLEKTFALSQVGTIKTKNGRVNAIRPNLAQHTVWLEGKKYFSQLKLDLSTRKLNVIMQSPEPKWNGKKNLSLPRGQIFCFYSQLPECLYLSGLLAKVNAEKGARTNFYILWDSYPYHQEHFSGLGESPFASARVVLEKRQKNSTQYNVETADQVLGLHFTKTGEFIRMFWTSQGISVFPPGEAEESLESL